MQTTFKLFKPLTLVAAAFFAQSVHGGLLQTQSNPVSFGGLYWGNPTNWNTLNIPRYQLDTASDGTLSRDINFVSIAHDNFYFYVRINYNQAPPFGGEHNLWLDTDLNPNTGARHWTGNASIGAEYLVTGAALIRDPYAWDFVAWLNWDQDPWTAGDLPRDVIFSINRASHLPGATAFDFTSQLYNNGAGATGDWYPDSADSQSGDFFRYTTLGAPEAPPTSSSDAYKNLVVGDGPLAYYRLSETAALSPNIATNSGSLGNNGDGFYTIGVKHPVAGAILGDANTAAHFSAVNTNSADGGVPTIVPWPEQPRIRELWDHVGVGNLNNLGSGTTSIGLDNGTNWRVNLGKIIRVAQDFDITTPSGPPYSRGQRGGLWCDTSDLGGLSHNWDTRSWATRKLAAGSEINFGTNAEYWITVRVNNTGDTAMGVGLASAGDGSGEFVGVGAIWDSAGGGSANNAIYLSDGVLGTDSPYTIRANSSAGTLNGPGLLVAHLVTSASGSNYIEATVFYPGDSVPTDPSVIAWFVNRSFTSSMVATHLLLWLNGAGNGELDAIRVANSYTNMFQGTLNLAGSFTIEAWLRPTIEGNAGNAQSPLFNRDPQDGVLNRAGWDFFQRDSATGWNFRMFSGVGTSAMVDLTGGAYTVGQWGHLVAVYDASVPSAKLYFNGVEVADSGVLFGTYGPTPHAPLSIGGYSDAKQNPFSGDIDEVAIYTNALAATNVLAHYQNGTNSARAISYSSLVLADGPLEYLRFAEPARNRAANSGTLGTDADGAYNLRVANGVPGPRSPGYTGFESSNTAAFFNGADSYIELRNPPALNFGGQITLEAWIQPGVTPAPPGGHGYIIAHGYDEGFYETVLRVDSSSGTPLYSVGTFVPFTGQGASSNAPAEDLGTGAWVHLVGTFDGANWNLYRNGALIASATDATGAVPVLDANWAIGARGRWAGMDVLSPGLERQFQGRIDEPAIYDRALSPDEVLAHYYVGAFSNPLLNISRSGADVILTWPVGTLQQADAVAGPYTDMVGATSPYVTPAGTTKKFYRVKL